MPEVGEMVAIGRWNGEDGFALFGQHDGLG